MMKVINNYFLVFVFLVSFILFFPSFSIFFTHDDFFHLLLAKAENPVDLINFFNISQRPLGYGSYRPITTQLFYFLGRYVFNLNPFWMHILAFSFFLALLILIYIFSKLITGKIRVSKIAVFLYATSSIHFMSLYFLGAFQEIGAAFFVLLSVILYLLSETFKSKRYILSLIFFILALTSKETGVITPFLIFISGIYLKMSNKYSFKFSGIKEILFSEVRRSIAHFLILFIYMYFRIFHYGFVSGDSYIWDFSSRFINTLFWYALWSFNIPEMLQDFIGPGLNINQNLFKFWSGEIIPILTLSGLCILICVILLIKEVNKNIKLFIFTLLWFLLSILPVLFLPLHKFTYYLTIPLIVLTLYISYLLTRIKINYLTYLFITFWLIGSFVTLGLTRQTHWVTKGAQTAKNADDYFQKNKELLLNKKIVFIDTDKDSDLPWKPTQILKASLSDQNYFKVFHPDRFIVYYGNEFISDNAIIIEARQFIGY